MKAIDVLRHLLMRDEKPTVREMIGQLEGFGVGVISGGLIGFGFFTFGLAEMGFFAIFLFGLITTFLTYYLQVRLSIERG